MKISKEQIKEAIIYFDGVRNDKERKFLNLLKEALNNENTEQLSNLLRFWDKKQDRFSMHQFLRNYSAYQQGLIFGFTDIVFDDYGWLKNENWQNVEAIEFKAKDSYLVNKITLGEGTNGKWSYGLYYGYAFEGGAFGLSAFYKVFNTYDDALEASLRDILNRLREFTPNPNAELKYIIKQIQDRLSILTKIDENNQLNLF